MPVLNPQRNLPLAIEARTVLVTVGTVVAARRIDHESVFAQVDNGDLQWVFDMSAVRNGRPDLRFLTRELVAPELCRSLTLGRVVEMILGQKQTFRSGEIEMDWDISHQTILRMRWAKELDGGKGTLTRTSLEHCLRTRWIGVHIPSSAPEQTGDDRLSALRRTAERTPARPFFKPTFTPLDKKISHGVNHE